MTAPEKPRIAGLDYLRGLAALAVMLFHYQKWPSDIWNANTVLGKSGVYAVSVFFVLSGLTLTLVYQHQRSDDPGRWFSYAVKRVFRIFPLLWLATIATLLLDDFTYPWQQILLNASGLFGFINPAGDIALGAWSIGNELVYYTAFPFLLWLGQHHKRWFGLTWAISILGGLWYAVGRLSPQQAITAQWAVYVEPLNHAFFFISGIAIGLWRSHLPADWGPYWKRGLALCGLLYVFYTPGADPAGLVTGVNRIVLSVLTIGMVGAWYGTNLSFPKGPDRVLRWLGDTSYSIYLLHPLAYRIWKFICLHEAFDADWIAPAAIVTTLMLSHWSYRLLEMPTMTIGRRLGRNAGSGRIGSG